MTLSTLGVFSLLLYSCTTQAQVGTVTPLAQRCPGLPHIAAVVCVNHYAAVLPYPFARGRSLNGDLLRNDTFALTRVPADPSFSLVSKADFIVFDEIRGLDILGSSPKLEFVFNTRNDSIHEAPVYVPPPLNAIIYSLPHQGIFEQQIINLNGSKPTIANYTTTPPVYAVNGGRYYNGHIYWAVEGGVPFPGPKGSTIMQTPGIYQLNPMTGRVTTLLNNYYGDQFNSPNDLYIDSRGDIWFTDSWYGYAINVTASPVLPTATYRFRPSTGAVSIVENTLQQPNGIGVSPDGRTMYLTDTGITDFSKPVPPNVLPRYTYNPLGGHAVYAFDVNFAPPGNYLTAKRPIWLTEEFADDGFHVARNGYLIGASGFGVDVLSEYGELLVRIETDYVVNNVQFAGPDLKDLWLFGSGGISRVKWNLQGMHVE